MPRKPSCLCGDCPKCKRRIAAKAWYDAMTPEERKAWVERRDKEKIRKRDVARAKTPERRAHTAKVVKAWREKHPERVRAHNAVARAVKDGRLVKQPCEVCGCERVHAHHDDYDKPLDVRWLCPAHHGEIRAVV